MQGISVRMKVVFLTLALTFQVGFPNAQTASPPSEPAREAEPAKRGAPQWWGEGVTPGWSMMSWKERNEHRKQMRSMKTQGECRAHLEQHHAQMSERARAKGKEPLGPPQHDPCATLSP